MFKLESYVTPVLLSYVEKYVKNVRAEQSQVSLWGGDVAFSNLDLRLDVLEQELRLPFTFVSGHIHELQIHVPWTRLNAEPIVITINTIECVLKLPSDGDSASDTASSSAVSLKVDALSKKKPRVKSGQEDAPAAPPGYVQSMINKIISNVSIVCNNLILKYVEDDIVLSLNVRNLCLNSADELWRPAFTELSLPHLILRKLVKVTDLTVCLDKRNASGKIDAYQEPLLYRCSLSVHAAWCYDSPLSKVPTVSRYEVRCQRLDFSLTDTQIPMFLRIANLALALYYGQIARRERKKDQGEAANKPRGEGGADPEEEAAAGRGESHHHGGDPSWSGWAWNVGTSFGSALLPIYWEDEEEVDVPKVDAKRDLVFHAGFYVESASLVLKLTEQLISDKSLFGSAVKQCFSTFLKLDCSGIFQEVVVRGVGAVNVSAGVGHLRITPVGSCVCGVSDVREAQQQQQQQEQDAETTPAYVTCGGEGGGGGSKNAYLRGSLFENAFGSEEDDTPVERRRSYKMDWDEHLERSSEEKMLLRSPAFAMDYIYLMEIPADFTSEQLSEAGYDLEYSDLDERALCRFVLGPSAVRVCSGLVHRGLTALHFASQYDYPPYEVELGHTATADRPVTQEEVETLSQGGVPLRVYQVTAINPSVVICHADHPDFAPERARTRRSSSSAAASATAQNNVSTNIETLPAVSLKLEFLDAQVSQPMYPRRAVRAAVHADGDPPKLLTQNCHLNVSAKVLNLTGHLLSGRHQSCTVLLPTDFQVGHRRLALPELWTGSKRQQQQVLRGNSFELGSLKVKATRPQVLAVRQILTSHLERQPRPRAVTDTSVLEDSLTKRMNAILLHVVSVKVNYDLAEKTQSLQASLENVSLSLCLVNPASASSATTVLPLLTRSSPQVVSTAAASAMNLATRSPLKSSPGRALTQAGKAKLEMASSAALQQEQLLNVFVQVPIGKASQRTSLSLAIGQVGEVQLCVDPSLLEWFVYSPSVKPGAVQAAGQQLPPSKAASPQQLATQTSVVSAASSMLVSTQSVTAAAILKRSKSTAASAGGRNTSTRSRRSAGTSEKGTLTPGIGPGRTTGSSPSSSAAWMRGLSEWFPTFNSMLVQFRMESHQVFLPKKTLSAVAGKTVLETVKKSQTTTTATYPVLGLSLPSVTLENVSHKPSVQQFLHSLPVEVPESVWSIRRDNLPWTLVMSDFSLFSHGSHVVQQQAAAESKAFLLSPVSTSCTLGLNVKSLLSREDGNSVALCVHADMSPIKMEVNEAQLRMAASMTEDLLAFLAKVCPDAIAGAIRGSGEDGDAEHEDQDDGVTAGAGPSLARPNLDAMSDTPPSQLSEAFGETGGQPPGAAGQKPESESESESSDKELSLWVQWTVPTMSFSALTAEDGSFREHLLQLTMEDCQSSFDWTPVYFKMKSRVAAANVACKVRKAGPSATAWSPAPDCRGIILSCADDLSHDLHFVNHRTNNVELLPHSRHFDAAEASFLNLTFTRAETGSVARKWRDAFAGSRKKAGASAFRFPAGGAASAAGSGGIVPDESDEDDRRFVSEIDLKLSPADVVVSPGDLLPFAAMLGHLFAIRVPDTLLEAVKPPAPEGTPSSSRALVGMGLNNNTLPLVHVRAKTLRVFLTLAMPEEVSHPATKPDFVLFQMDSFVVSPQADNPLARILVRPDVYHMATPVLTVPGSYVEDRQYQANASGLGVFTGKWTEVLKKSERPVSKAGQDLTMGENPAFEWNQQAASTVARESVPAHEVLLLPCLAKFDLQVTLAPAIVLNTWRGVGRRPGRRLIAGHAAEVNALSDICLYFSLCQLEFFNRFSAVVIRDVLSVCRRMRGSRVVRRRRHPPPSDSGIDCEASQRVPTPTTKPQQQQQTPSQKDPSPVPRPPAVFVPFELLVTGSCVTVTTFRLQEGERAATKRDRSMWRKFRYRHRRNEILQDRANLLGGGADDSDLGGHSDGGEAARRLSEASRRMTATMEAAASASGQSSSPTTGFDVGYEASEEGSVDEMSETIKVFPLVHTNISQPHLFLSWAKDARKVDVSFYDASVDLSPPDYFVTCGGKRLPDVMDFPSHWFQSKQGDPDKSGIPPALLTCTLAISPCSLRVRVERPLKFDLGLEPYLHLVKCLDSVRKAADVEGLLEMVRGEKKPEEKDTGATTTTAAGPPVKTEEGRVEVLRQQLAPVTAISASIKQIVLHYPAGGGGGGDKSTVVVTAGLMGADLSVKMASKKGAVESADADVSLDRATVAVGVCGVTQTVMGPWSVTAGGRLSWLGGCSELPVAQVNVRSEQLNLAVGPNLVLAHKIVQEEAAKTKAKSEEEHNGRGEVTATAETEAAEPTVARPPSPVEQHYKDDLRAGAFQYVSSGSDPKPYQVVFGSHPPAMTWRYPQQRTLTRVSVFPVPFLSAAPAAAGADEAVEESVSCALQYWDACLGSYQTYSEFDLSEVKVNHLNLPTVGDRKRVAVSDKWRVLLHDAAATADEAEEESGFEKVSAPGRPEIIATAKSLVSVVRVDSYYSSGLVPSLQLSVAAPRVEVAVSNQLHFAGRRLTADGLRQYVLSNSYPMEQQVATLKLDSLSVGVDSWMEAARTNVRMRTGAKVDVVDYTFLASHTLAETSRIQAQVSHCRGEGGGDTLDAQFHCRPVTVRAGHFAFHTATASTALWKSVLAPTRFDPSSCCVDRPLSPSSLLARFAVCNDTPRAIRFGQADTDENLLLKPGECHMYSWRSPSSRLMIRLCVEGGFWKWCEPFSLNCGVKVVRQRQQQQDALLHHPADGQGQGPVVVSITPMGKTMQRKVSVGGSLVAASLLQHNLEMKIVTRPNTEDNNSPVVDSQQQAEQRTLLASFSSTPSFVVDLDSVQGVKVRFLGIGTPWSGEIPLKMDKGRRQSALVRIPTKEKGLYQTVWCRLVEESLGGTSGSSSRRALLLFSPMYVARSLLAGPMKMVLASLNVKGSEREVDLPGRSVPVQLPTLGPSDQKYSVALKVSDDLPASDPIVMSWGVIEQVRKEQAEAGGTGDVGNIDQLVADVPKRGILDLETNWPYTEEAGNWEDGEGVADEEGGRRRTNAVPPLTSWASNVQPKTDVQVSFSQFHPLCNTLCLEINPWCLIVNQLGLPLVLKVSNSGKDEDHDDDDDDKDCSSFEMADNSVFVPPPLPGNFYLGIRDGGECFYGPAMRLSDQEWRFRTAILPASIHGGGGGFVPKEGVVQTKIALGGQICFLTVRSRSEGGIRIMHVKPTFLLANRAERRLLCAPVSVVKKRREKKADLDRLDLVSMEVPRHEKGAEDDLTAPMLLWQVLGGGEASKTHLFDGFQHLFLSEDGGEWSLPINLDDCRSIEEDRRWAVSVPCDCGDFVNRSLVVTVHQREGQVFVVVCEDEAPAMVIVNNLPARVKYAQWTKKEGELRKTMHAELQIAEWCRNRNLSLYFNY